MPDDNPNEHPAAGESITQEQPVQNVSGTVPINRSELLARARTFLTSPQVQLQDPNATRAFLAEKGLNSTEIEQLLRELPPSVPPRTYPALSPSNLPNLLLGVARIFTWLTASSAVILFVYYRYLFARLAQSYQVRLALRKHYSLLVARLTESTSALKATQAESYKDLPRIIPVYEDHQFAECHSMDDLLSHAGSSGEGSTQPGEDIPDITILRCALEELGRSNVEGTSTEELFHHLENKLSWLGGDEGMARQSVLWNQLNTCPLFVSSMPRPSVSGHLPLDHPSRLLWKYVPPSPPTTSPLLANLANLQAALPQTQKAASGSPASTPTISARQRTLQVLSDLTGYITTQTYSFGLASIRGTGDAASASNLVDDELRREIRALKGLVLNRRSFLSSGAGTSGLVGTLGSS